MFYKITKFIFCGLFLGMLTVPLLTTNLKEGKVSVAENRRLAQKPNIYTTKGTLNRNFAADFETWINDNIGFRSNMVMANAKMQYYLFDVLSNNSEMYLGPKGEFNYATAEMISDYQHNNLYSDEYLQQFGQSMQDIGDYIKSKGAQCFYYQCWDKHSIYPEQFPETVIQRGEKSKTDGIVEAIDKYSDVKLISPKKDLIEGKDKYPTYSKWGDYVGDIKSIVDAYDADIVVIEAAERVDRTSGIIEGAEKIRKDK